MNLPLWLDNIAAYSIQIALLITAGALLQYILRIRVPALLLRGWQMIVIACILLPVLQPWNVRVIPSSPPAPALAPFPGPLTASPNPPPASFPAWMAVACILAGGIALRLAWLAMGLLRLHAYRRASRLLTEVPAAVTEMQRRVGVSPDFYLCNEISGPVTFGLHPGAVLLPASFLEMDGKLQQPIACHELLHVRRRDWIFVVLEDVIRSLFWFHPAIWWAVGRIQLHREQVVDRDVLSLTGEKQPYLQSLLHIAGLRIQRAAVPAPLFLKETHLVQRVSLMLREVSMSRSRMIATVCAVVPLLFTSARFGTAWFPLNGLPVVGPATGQEYKPVAKPKREPIRVSTIVQESKLMVKINPVLPKKALEAHVSGMVILQLAVNEDGDVYDIKVMRGHPLLDEAAVDAARQWHYSPTLLNGEPVPVVATANVMFANARLSLTMDQNGNLRDPVSQHEGDELIQSMRRSPLGVTINPSINAPMPVLHNVLRLLVSEGITEVQVAGFLIYDGRLFANAAAEGSSAAPPSMVVDNDRLAAIAKASGLVGNLSAREKPLLYYLFINEVGEIAGLRQVRGPHVAAVETELLHTRVISPGTRGGETIPVAVLVEVAVP